MTYCLIYKITNTANDKVYIGQTWCPMQVRWNQHIYDATHGRTFCAKLYRAIRKYGVEAFRIEFITLCHTQEVADQLERQFIKQYKAITKGYNIREGGSHGKLSASTKAKISISVSKAKLGKPNPHKGSPRKGIKWNTPKDQRTQSAEHVAKRMVAIKQLARTSDGKFTKQNQGVINHG